jgi:putative transcriptional regulator
VAFPWRRCCGRAIDIFASVHKTAAGLHKAGLVNKATMREFDVLCLAPVEPLAPEQIRALREREQVSQPIFALPLRP